MSQKWVKIGKIVMKVDKKLVNKIEKLSLLNNFVSFFENKC